MKTLVALFVLTISAFANALTCTDGNGHSVTYDGSSVVYQGLDLDGIPSNVAYSITGSSYVQVPGGPSYSEYTAVNGRNQTLVRLSTANPATAQVFVGSEANGNPIFTGQCNSTTNTIRSDVSTSSGTCYVSSSCVGITVGHVEEISLCPMAAESFLLDYDGSCEVIQ